MKIARSLFGLMLATSMAVPVYATYAAANSETAPQKFQQAVSNFESRVQDRIDDIKAAKESGARVDQRLALADEALTKTSGAILEGEIDVLYLYVAGAQEKRVLRSLLLGLDGKIRQRLEHVEAINDALDNGRINSDTAEDLLSVDLEQAQTDLETYKEMFRANTLEFMMLKAKAAKTYLGDSLDYGDMTVSAYQNMDSDGQDYIDSTGATVNGTPFDTTKAATLLSTSRSYYDEANTLYESSKDGQDEEDIKNMQKALILYVRSRQMLSHAQVLLKQMDVVWDSARTSDCDITADDTTGEATDDQLCSEL